MRKIVVKLMYVYYAIKHINSPKLGEEVTHKGEKYSLIQGVMNPYWDLFNHDKGRINRIHVSEFKQSNSINAIWFRFKSHYDFLMGCWFYIDSRSSLIAKINYRN